MCLAFLHRHEDALAQYDMAIAVRANDARYYHNRSWLSTPGGHSLLVIRFVRFRPCVIRG